MKKNIMNNKWEVFSLNLENKLINNITIKELSTKFKYSVLNKLNPDQILVIMFKIKNINNNFYSITYLHKIKIKDFDSFVEICLSR